MGSGKIKYILWTEAKAMKKLIRHKLMDIAHAKKQLMDEMMTQTSESMTRNPSHQTEHAKKSNENWEIQNAWDIMLIFLKSPILCAISCSLSHTGILQSLSQF